MSEPTNGTVCVGSCNRDYRRAEQRKFKTGELHALHPVQGVPWWCDADSRRIAAALTELLKLYVALEGDKGRRTSNGEKTSGSKSAPSPSPQDDAQDEMVRLLMRWEDAVREARQMTLRTGARTGVTNVRGEHVGLAYRKPETRTLTSAVAFLTGNLGWILAAERTAALQFGQDILNARSRYQRLVGAGGGASHRPMPCPRCDMKTLVHKPGSPSVDCTNAACGRILSLDEYDELARSIAAGRISA